MSIIEYLDTSYLKTQLDKLSNLNIALSDLRDAIIGVNARSLSDIYDLLYDSTNAKSTAQWLADIYTKLGNIGGSVSVANFPTWFTSSTKTTDDLFTDLEALKGALASVGTDTLRTELSTALPAGDNVIGRVKLTDGTSLLSLTTADLAGSSVAALPSVVDLSSQFAGGTAYTEQAVSVTTTAATSTFSPPLKMAVLCNQGSVDVTIQLNGGTTTKTLTANTCKAIAFWKISSISYSTASGTSTLLIEGYW